MTNAPFDRAGFRELREVGNAELLNRYNNWLISQRYSRTSREVYGRVTRRFSEFWGERHFSEASHIDVREFIAQDSARDLSAEVVHRYLWALRSFFDFLCMNGVVDEVSPRLIRPRPAKKLLPRALSKKCVSRLIRAAQNPRDRAMLEMFYATGCRISELLNVRLEHIDFKKRTIMVNGKFGDRRVFFGRAAEKSLLAYLKGRSTGFLFESQYLVQKGCVSWNGSCWAGYWLDYSDKSGIPQRRCVALGPASLGSKGAWEKFKERVPNPDIGHVRRKPHCLTRMGVSQIFKEAAFRAGIGKATSHNLRHSFAVHMLDNGADIRHIQELLGHTSLATTHRYAQVAAMPLEHAYKKFHPRS